MGHRFSFGACWHFILGACLATSVALAADSRVKDLLRQAEGGKQAYLEALDSFARELPPSPRGPQAESQKRVLYSWIASLDEWSRLGRAVGLTSPYQSALAESALELTRNAAPVVHLGRDSWESLVVFFRWSDDLTRLVAAQQQTQWESGETAKKPLLFWHGRLTGAMALLGDLGAGAFVLEAFSEVDSRVVSTLLARLDWLDDAEMDRILEKCSSGPPIQAALDRLEEAAGTVTDAALAAKLLDWALRLARNLQTAKSSPSYALRSYAGRVAMDALSKLLLLHGSTSPEKAAALFAVLVPGQYAELGSSLVEVFHSVSLDDTQVDFVFALGRALLGAQKMRGAIGPSRELDRLVQGVGLRRLERDLRFEGTYAVMANGNPGIVTLVLSGGGSLIASLQLSRYRVPGIHFSFFRVAYDLETGGFLAHRYAAEVIEYLPPDESNPHFSFQLAKSRDGKRLELRGTFNNSLERVPVTGYQTAALPPLSAQVTDQKWESLDHTYANQDWELTITQVGQETTGSLDFRKRTVEIPLPVGFLDSRRRTLHLNSGEQRSGSHLQVRGRLSPDGELFEGYSIVGGRGFTPLRLRRVR